MADFEFRRLLDKLPAAAYTCDAEGLLTYYNVRAVELWGREPALNSPTDRFCGSYRLFASDGSPIPHERCFMARALKEQQPHNGCELVVERPDGSRWDALAHANLIHDETGRICGGVNVLVEITERKLAERVVRDADQRKSQFLALMAHELRNPLAPLRNGLQIMRLARHDSDAVEQARLMMERQVALMVQLIDGLMSMYAGGVEAHGDGPGTGGEFVARSPVPAAASGDVGRGPRGPLPRQATGYRMLVVDDNEDSATSLGLILKLDGNEVRMAHDGEAAVQSALEFHPQVILLDIGLPRLSGYEVCRRIRSASPGGSPVIIALTGYAQDADKARAKEAGFNFHLAKPVDPAMLQLMLSSLLMVPE